MSATLTPTRYRSALSQSSIFALVLATSLSAAGCRPSSALNFTAGDAYDFGQVKIGDIQSADLVVKNVKKETVSVGDMSDLGVRAPFEVLSGGTCLQGLTLASGQSCSIKVKFTPTTPGDASTTLSLNYLDKKKKPQTVSLTLYGKGLLDCTKSAVLQAGYDRGAQQGRERNASEAAAGTLRGQSLTTADGQRDGYSDGYANTYTNTYETTYRNSYTVGYNEGLYAGRRDSSSCNAGRLDGEADGASDGSATGYHDGYNAGYDDGYAHGYPIGYDHGYDVGYTDGYTSCGSNFTTPVNATTSPRKPISVATRRDLLVDPLQDPSNVQACEVQGYNAVYDSYSLDRAYNAAKRANVAYQAGYSAYYPLGQNDGRTDGAAQGQFDGLAAGRNDGFPVGAKEAYQDCYNTAYGYSYTSYYSVAYADRTYGYPAGYSSGDGYGYQSGDSKGYTDGYAKGRRDFCPGQNIRATVGGSTRIPVAINTYGKDQPWAKVTDSGLVVDVFMERPLVSKQLTKTHIESIQKIRKEARTRLGKLLRANELPKATVKSIEAPVTSGPAIPSDR